MSCGGHKNNKEVFGDKEMIYFVFVLFPIFVYLLANRRKRFDDPFMSGFEYRARRIKYKDPWILFSFLFIIFEEFLILIVFLAPQSLEMIIFYFLIISSILLVVGRWYSQYP